MLQGARIAVVVPAYDVEARIEATLRGIPAFVDAVVVVDDASRDATSERVVALGDARVSLLRHPENRGVGAAIVTGYREAARHAELLVVMAGDAQMDPEDLPALLQPLLEGEAEYVKGERLSHPEVWRCMPWGRLLGTAILGWLTSLATGLPRIRDGQCGYTALVSSVLPRLDLDTLWPRYGYPNELLGVLAREGLRVREVPVRPVYQGEASGLRLRHVVLILGLIARVGWRRWSARGRSAPLADAPPLPRAR